MKNKIAIIILAMLCVLSVAFFFYLKDEESRIKSQFENLAGWVNKKDEKESLFKLAVISHNAENIFVSKCLIDIHYSMINGKKSPDQLARYALRARNLFNSIDLAFHDITVDIYSANNAHVVTTATLQAESSSRMKVNDITELDCELKKIDGKWLFTEIKTVEILKK